MKGLSQDCEFRLSVVFFDLKATPELPNHPQELLTLAVIYAVFIQIPSGATMIPLLAQASAEASISMWPFAILSICVVFIVVAITMLRVHAFLALILAAILAGILTGDLPNLNDLNKGLFDSRVALDMTDLKGNNLIKSVKWSLKGFGNTAGGIGLVIALAAIIGTCLMGSGAADRIVRSLLKVCGEKRAGMVLLMSGFLLSIPVFFDTVFFLLIPLARALSLRTGKSYTMYVIAMAGAGAITHSMVPPTPGPLMIANTLKIDLGVAIMAGLAASILPAWLVLVMAKRFDDKLNIPMRDVPGTSAQDLKSIVDKKDSELPGLFVSSIPVAFPVVAISLVSVLDMLGKDQGKLYPYLQFIGHSNIAMLIAAAFAVATYAAQLIKNNPSLKGNLSKTLSEKLDAPLHMAGVIILITGAGGAFGGMIRLAGVGETIQALADKFNISYILLAWLATAIVRIAQGSATVAMITGVGLMAAVIGDGAGLTYHPLYIFLAVGFGSITLSWMNDSGFWVVQRLSGFTEKETLRTWSVLLTAISLLGLVEILVFSRILPFAG